MKNPQFNAIIRQYDLLRQEHNHHREERLRMIYKNIPEYEALDEEIAHIAAECARKAVLEPGSSAPAASGRRWPDLENRQHALLVKNGYPMDYLDIHYRCPDCRDTGFIGNEKCHCFKQAVVDLVDAQSRFANALNRKILSISVWIIIRMKKDRRLGISPRENMDMVLTQCKNFIRYFDDRHENLLLYGNTGVGKTFLSNCIAKALLDTAHTVIYLTAFQLVEILERKNLWPR